MSGPGWLLAAGNRLDHRWAHPRRSSRVRAGHGGRHVRRAGAGAVRPQAQSDPFSQARWRVEKTLAPNHSGQQ